MRVKNLICVGCQEEYLEQTQAILKEILNTYRQHIQQPELQQIDVECYIIAFSGGDFKIMSFFAIREDNEVLRVICDIIF